MDEIIIKGARAHNLKNIDIAIPKNKLIVFTGISGSGKSSLAFDTIYAEGQRRYVESLAPYARQFLGVMDKPDVDYISGLSPAISIDQKSVSHNPRSTVGTVTEIYDYLRLLFARIGHPHCPTCGREICQQSPPQIVDRVLKSAKEKLTSQPVSQFRFMVLSPIIRDKKGEFTRLFDNLRVKGLTRVRIDSQVFGLSEDLVLIKTNKHTIEAVVDRLTLGKKQLTEEISLANIRSRLTDSIEQALLLSDGLVIISQVLDSSFSFPDFPKKMNDSLFSENFACPNCNISLPPIEPRTFSFNSPYGACPTCNGIGALLKVDPNLVLNPNLSISELERHYRETTSNYIRMEIEKYMRKVLCPTCQGGRLKKEALGITIEGKSIVEVSQMSIIEMADWHSGLNILSSREKIISSTIIKEIQARLNFLKAVGLDYLTINRPASTLAGGETQRIRLASQIGSGLSGVLYVLDEPSVGLHQRDNKRLIETLKRLRDLGNTVIVVEHDREMMESADWILDFGPGAGDHGGKIVASGTVGEIKNNRLSLTGDYLAGRRRIKLDQLDKLDHLDKLEIRGCRQFNLKNIDVSFPLGKFICVSGVSGSGKSTLVVETLYHGLMLKINPYHKEKPGTFKDLVGQEKIDKVILIDQSPIGRTPRSNPATYTGAFSYIRDLFARLPEAKIRGYKAGRFSFNVKNGRCENCQGEGEIKVEMQFLPDVYVKCEVCHGRRYNDQTLEVFYKAKNIAEVLDLTVEEAGEFFANIPGLFEKLETLDKVGLSYIHLGQPAPTLSGGEAQRVKLAAELSKRATGRTLYILDEPTTGLHFADLEKLLAVLRLLVEKGNTVIVIEHNLDVVKNADYIIDLGPGGGDEGGEVVAAGAPKEVSLNKRSYTGQFLARLI